MTFDEAVQITIDAIENTGLSATTFTGDLDLLTVEELARTIVHQQTNHGYLFEGERMNEREGANLLCDILLQAGLDAKKAGVPELDGLRDVTVSELLASVQAAELRKHGVFDANPPRPPREQLPTYGRMD